MTAFSNRPSLPVRLFKALLRTVLFLLLAVALLALWGFVIEPRWVAAREIDVPVQDWRGPPDLKVVVASDWHMGHLVKQVMTLERARDLVERINASQPDVILLPGDFIYGRGEDGTTPEEIAAVLGGLHATRGVYAVLGNHDWWSVGQRLTNAMKAAGITVLRNDAVPLPGTPLWVVGIGDRTTGHEDVARAMDGLPAHAQTLVFMHDPASVAGLPPTQQGLIVAAHTHGGQSWIPFYGSAVTPHGWPRDKTHGWVDAFGHRLYITSGLGVSIFPIRVNMRPEWVTFRLHAPGG